MQTPLKVKREGAPFGNRNRAKGIENLRPVTIRLLPIHLDKLKRIAIAQNISYNELIRNWIDTLKAP